MKRILIAIAIFIAATPATAFAVDRDDDVTALLDELLRRLAPLGT